MKRRRRWHEAVCLTAGIVLAATATTVAAQEAGVPVKTPTAQFLPEETMLLFEMRNVSATGKRLV